MTHDGDSAARRRVLARAIRKVAPLCVTALMAAASLSLPAAAQSAAKAEARSSGGLGLYSGSWSGRGSVRVAPGVPMISVSCSFNNEVSGDQLQMQGKCGGGLMSSTVNTSLRRTGGDNYAGHWTTGDRRATLSGARRGNTLSLAVDEPSEPPRHMTLSAPGNQLQLVMTRRDTGAEVMRISLNRD